MRREEGYIALLNEDKAGGHALDLQERVADQVLRPVFNAKNNEIAMETVEIVAEDLQIQL